MLSGDVELSSFATSDTAMEDSTDEMDENGRRTVVESKVPLGTCKSEGILASEVLLDDKPQSEAWSAVGSIDRGSTGDAFPEEGR